MTNQSGSPASGSTGLTSFTRVDFDLSPRNTLTIEGLVLPGTTLYAGLSPLRQPESSPDLHSLDVFAGVVDRIVLEPSELLTLRVGVLNHQTEINIGRFGDAILRPDGWHQNWFSGVDTSGAGYSASATWDRAGISAAGTHTFSVSGEVRSRTMSSTMEHQTIQIQDDFHRLTRQIEFEGLNGPIETDGIGAGMGFRDLWDPTARLQLDLDVRFDWTQRSAALVSSPRVAVRYALDDEIRTIIKASVGRFVGLAPLGALASRSSPPGPTRRSIRRQAPCSALWYSGPRLARWTCRVRTASHLNWSTGFAPVSTHRRLSACARASICQP